MMLTAISKAVRQEWVDPVRFALKQRQYNRWVRKEIKKRNKALKSKGMKVSKPSKNIERLSKGQGVYIGGYYNEFTERVEALMDNADTHVLVVAPTRAGKGVGIILPTALTYTGSMIVHDKKGELWAFSSGFRRAMGHRVLKFMPEAADGSSCRFNPLEEVRWGSLHEVADLGNIAEIIMDPTGKESSGNNGHWTNNGKKMFMLIAVNLWYDKNTPKEYKNLAGIARAMSMLAPPDYDPSVSTEHPAKGTFRDMMTLDHTNGGKEYWWTTDPAGRKQKTHPIVAQNAGDMLAKADQELGSVISAATTKLLPYNDPIVADNTSRSEFRIRDLMHGDRPTSLYLVITNEHSARLAPLFQLLITQMLKRNTGEMKFTATQAAPDYKWAMLLLLDEFATMGNIKQIADSITDMAGYGIRGMYILQTTASLTEVYGESLAKQLLGNCSTKVYFSPNDDEQAEKATKALGKKTVVAVETSISGKRSDFAFDAGNLSLKDDQIDLLTPAEFMQMHQDEMLIVAQGKKPIRGRKFYFYHSEELKRRQAYPRPAESDRLRSDWPEPPTPMERKPVPVAETPVVETPVAETVAPVKPAEPVATPAKPAAAKPAAAPTTPKPRPSPKLPPFPAPKRSFNDVFPEVPAAGDNPFAVDTTVPGMAPSDSMPDSLDGLLRLRRMTAPDAVEPADPEIVIHRKPPSWL